MLARWWEREFGLPSSSAEFQALTLGELRRAWWRSMFERRAVLRARVLAGDKAPETKDALAEMDRLLRDDSVDDSRIAAKYRRAMERGDLSDLQTGLPEWIASGTKA